MDYDYPQGAIVVSNLNNYCTSGGTYNTSTATPDHSKGSCWSNGPNNNRWFKFQAVYSSVTVQAKVSGAGETMRNPFLALWDASLTQLACQNYLGGAVDISVSYVSLTPGNWYYFSVDNYAGYSGTFDICVNNVSALQYYSIADGNWNTSAVWSTTGFGGITAGTIPGLANIVNIQDHSVTITSPQSCDQINMTAGAVGNSILTVDNSTLTVNGQYIVTNGGFNNSAITTIQNTGTLVVNDNATFTRNGGNSDFQLNIGTGCSMTVGNDMIWTSTAGTVKQNLMTLNGTGALTITRDLTLSSSGGMLINHTLNNTSSIIVGRDLTFTATAAGQDQMVLNNTSGISIKRSLVRGATPYGMFTFNNSSTLTLNGVVTQQTLPASAGSGGDAISYMNLTVNNTSGFVDDILLGGPVTINGTLTNTNGVIQSSVANSLTMAAGAVTSIGSSSSYIDGPVNFNVAASGVTSLNFPLGKSTDWRPVILSVDHSAATSFTYTAEVFNASAYALNYTLAPTTDKVSSINYWQIDRSSTLNLNSATVTLYYGNASPYNDWVTDYTNLTVVKNTSATPAVWTDINGAATGNGVGSITSGSFGSFSKFTIANKMGGTNPLPVELLSFDAKPNNNNVDVFWQTASEKNCYYFSVEKSRDGNSYSEAAQLKGAGNSSVTRSYRATDHEPFNGKSYYRLRQADFNGKSYYSNIVPVEFSSASNALNVYPSLSSGDFTVSYSGETGKDVLLVIRNILGQEFYSKGFILENDLFVQSVNLSGQLAPGIYFVVASSDDRIFEKKVVIK